MLYALPTILEKRFADYIRANYEGSYNVFQAWTTDDYQSPAIILKAGDFRELTPFSHVYEGSLAIIVLTQIDDQEDPVTIHDNTLASIYDLIADQESLYAFANQSGGNLHLYEYYITAYDQEREQRELKSVIMLTVNAQTLEITHPPQIQP